MIYFKIAYIAIQRYRMENNMRQLFKEHEKIKNKRLPFGSLVGAMCTRGIISKKQRNQMRHKYKKLSTVLHGN